MADETVDAVVIGAGHNGLVAASMLADAGWDVLVLEAQPEPGGAVRSAELAPGYVTDLFSSYYPMAVASPAMAALRLEDHGLRWSHAPAVVGHPRGPSDDDPPIVYHDPDRTAAEFERRAPGDGENWLRAVGLWDKVKKPLLEAILSPFPPMRPLLTLLHKLGTSDALRVAKLLVQPANTMAAGLFDGDAPRVMLMGNALHADIPLDAPGSAMMGFLMTMLAQDHGWPLPIGGSGQLTAALVGRARSAGRGSSATRTSPASRCEPGARQVSAPSDRWRAPSGRRGRYGPAAVLPHAAPDVVPPGLLRDLRHFEWDPPVVKVNYALDAPIPWRATNLRDVGTVHLGADGPGLVRWMADVNTRTVPEHPFMLLGQTTTADPTRSPTGTESIWAYTHLPREVYDDASAERLAESVDRVIEEHAPGFGSHIVGRFLQRPSDLEAHNANLFHGAINGGTSHCTRC